MPRVPVGFSSAMHVLSSIGAKSLSAAHITLFSPIPQNALHSL